ncbi:MAG: hypothetical protein ABI847_09890, partial [Anaerolineales bacterium]
ALSWGTGEVISATDNSWGTTDTTAIRARIYDNNVDLAVGTVNIIPILSQPEPAAPAFLYQAALIPASPVGIQAVTFDLTFSGPMDQSINPVVTFGPADSNDTFTVADNAQWVDPAHWRAVYDFTSIVPRGTYSLSVSGARGDYLMEIPPDKSFTFTVDYAGQITDQTPPNSPYVFASGVNGVPSSVLGNWHAGDTESAVIHYRYAIGTASGVVDVVNWTLSDATQVARTGLGLVSGQHYWLSVEAQNQGGLWSTPGSDEFIAGVKKFVTVFFPLIHR